MLRSRTNALYNLFRPELSVVVVIFRMPEQAQNTLVSLTSSYQNGVSGREYEVVVVENSSNRLLGRKTVEGFGRNFKYHLHEEVTSSPVNALNYGIQKSRGSMVALMVDGARLLTPSVIRYTLMARKISDLPIVAVPGYHLGKELQQVAVSSGYNEQKEKELLDLINWPSNGYGLFDISCFSGTCRNGFFNPIAETNFLAVSKYLLHKVGKCDPAFDLPGGGLVNLDLYKRCCEYPGTTLFMLIGEGTFHQFHNGTTTGGGQPDAGERQINLFRLQYQQIRKRAYTPPVKSPVVFGKIPDQVQKFVASSSKKRSGIKENTSAKPPD